MQITNANRNRSNDAGYTRILILWMLVGLILGAVAGAGLAHHKLGNSSENLSQWLALSEYENLALLQYRYADTEHAKQSLQDILKFMDHAESNRLVVDKRTLEIDRGLTYIRLALLDEKSGDIESSRSNMEIAAQILKLDDPSETHLRQIIAKLDSNLP